MAETPESSVFLGREGTGAAQVFGREGDPFRGLLRRRQDDARMAQIRAVQEQKAKEARDKKTWELINVDPEKAWAPFNQQVVDQAGQLRQSIMQQLEQNPSLANDPGFQMKVKQGWNQVNDAAVQSNYVKDKIDQVRQVIKDNPYLDTQYYHRKLNDLVYNGTQPKPLGQVDLDAIDNVYVNDPAGFNKKKYMDDFMKNIEENVFNYQKSLLINGGLSTENVKEKIKGELYTPDPTTKSGVMEDENGRPIINATPELVNSVLSNENADRAFNLESERTGIPVKQLIESMVRPQGAFSKEVNNQFHQNPEWYYDYQHGKQWGISPKDAPFISRFWDNGTALVNAFQDENGNRLTTPSDRAKEALGYIKKNAKISGASVLDAMLLPGTNEPGVTEAMGMKKVPNDPNDRIVFKVKEGTGANARTKPYVINLNDEGAMAEIFGIFKGSSSGEMKKYNFDQVAGFLEKDPSSVYQGQRVTEEERNAMAEKQNQQIKNWTEFKDLNQLVGKSVPSLGNKRLKTVYSTTNLIGNKNGLIFEFSDGTKKEIDPEDAKNYKMFEEFYNTKVKPKSGSSSTSTSGGKKSTGIKWD